MAELSAAIPSSERPIQRISLHELYRRKFSYLRHSPSISSTPASQSSSSRDPGLGLHKCESIDPDETESEENHDSAVTDLDGAADDAGCKSRTCKKAGKRHAHVPNTKKEEEALGWLNRALTLIKATSPVTKIDGIDGVHTLLWGNRLSKKFKRGITWMYTQLQTGALPHTTLLPQLFGQIVGSSSFVNAPFRAQPKFSNSVLEASTCKNFPFENLVDYMKAAMQGQLPLSGPDSHLLLLPMKQTNSSSAPPNGPLHAKQTRSNAPPPAQTNTFNSSKLVQQPAQTHWRRLSTPDLAARNASLKSGMQQADAMLVMDTVKTLLPHRRFRQIRDVRVKENVRPYRKQSVAWAAFRIGRNISGQSTHYDALARHPFHDNQLLRGLWEETRDAWAETRSGDDKEGLKCAKWHAEFVKGLILEDRRVTRSDGERADNVVVRMGGCPRLVDMAWLVTIP